MKQTGFARVIEIVRNKGETRKIYEKAETAIPQRFLPKRFTPASDTRTCHLERPTHFGVRGVLVFQKMISGSNIGSQCHPNATLPR